MILSFFTGRLVDAVEAMDVEYVEDASVLKLSERSSFLVEDLVVTTSGSTHLHGKVVVFSGRRP